MPNSVTYLDQTPIFKRYVVIVAPDQKGIMCFKETGLRTQNMMTILSSIANMVGGTYMTI